MNGILPFVAWMRVFVACLLALAACLWVESAHAQEADPLTERLERAAMKADAEQIMDLVGKHRLMVKSVVTSLITESLYAELSGNSEHAAEWHAAADRLAAAFEQHFGETSLSEIVGYVDRWSSEEMRTKLQADSLLAVGRELRSGEEALQAYQDALAAYRSIGDRLGAAEVLGGLGVVHWYAGEGDSTLAYFQRALEARRAVDDRQLIGNSLNDLGSASRAFRQDYKTAAEYYLQAASVREDIGAETDLARTYSYAALAYDFLGQPSRSLDLYERAIAIADRLSINDIKATSLHNSGVVLKNTGRQSEAIDRFERAARIFREIEDSEGLVDALNMAGSVYRRLGDFDAAIDRYQEVIEISERTENAGAIANAYLNLGTAVDHAGRPERATGFYEQALERYRQLDHKEGELWALTGLSNTHLATDQYAEAKEYAGEVLQNAQGLEDKSEISRALSTLANAQVYLGEGRAAIENYQHALDIAREVENPELIWIALMGFGEYHEREGDFLKAIQFYQEAVSTTEGVRRNLQTVQDRSGYVSQVRYVYENMIHLLGELNEGHPDEDFDQRAFELLERAKARSFLDLLSEAEIDLRAEINPDLLAEHDKIVAAIGEIQRQIQQAASSEGISAILDSLRTRRSELEDDYHAQERKIRLESPVYASVRYPDPATLQEVQTSLTDEHTLLLQYALGDSSSTLWAVTRDDARMYRLPPRSVLREQVEILQFALADATSKPEGFAPPARRLFELLIKPAEELLDESSRVVVVPDDILHYLPFETLLTDAGAGQPFSAMPYLVREVSMTYGPSASVLLEAAKNTQDRSYEKGFIGFGDPDFGTPQGDTSAPLASNLQSIPSVLADLPYSGVEIQTIAELFESSERDVFLGQYASEEIVKSPGVLADYRFVHFATHGIIDEERPDFSGLALARTERSTEDGFLQAAEIFGLGLDAELVVLSACETGLGKMVRGEGVVGLVRAFMYAGAPSLVVSLWRVADKSTSELMQRFYSEMVEGEHAKANALQRAKLSFLAEEKLAHPFHWAPFIMIGDQN